MKEVKNTEIKLRRLRIPETIIDVIKRLLFKKVSQECYGLYELYIY